MKKGTTSTGFKFSITDDAMDDWELLENLSKIDSGDVGVVVKVIPTLLGEKQAEKLKEHCRVNGKVRITRMTEELSEILQMDESSKKSSSSQE